MKSKMFLTKQQLAALESASPKLAALFNAVYDNRNVFFAWLTPEQIAAVKEA